ncbi:MAG: AI-2E family transporter [Legionellaceae bacterium]|nr:AI-2E family transporter [Legionellaceae bacterium]
MNRTVSFAAGLLLVLMVGYLLIAGRGLLIPFVIAIFIWHLLNTFNSALQGTPWIGVHLPPWLTMIISLSIVGVLVQMLISILGNNVNEVMAASSRYQENLMRILNSIDERFQIKLLSNLEIFIKSLSVQHILVNITSVFTTITSSAVLIILYVVFLFVEQHFFQQKIRAIFTKTKHRHLVDNIMAHIVSDTQTYLGLKTLMSLLTAFASYLIMKMVRLDFAEFWALLIFFLNFIPNIGAIIATVFPALLALIQFQNWWPFILLTSGLVSVQFVIGNLIEPRFMGKSLNLSPLVILIALGVWGAIWGILGMFLSVPITVMLMIVFAHFESTKAIAIILSQDGCIQKLSSKMETGGLHD